MNIEKITSADKHVKEAYEDLLALLDGCSKNSEFNQSDNRTPMVHDIVQKLFDIRKLLGVVKKQ